MTSYWGVTNCGGDVTACSEDIDDVRFTQQDDVTPHDVGDVKARDVDDVTSGQVRPLSGAARLVLSSDHSTEIHQDNAKEKNTTIRHIDIKRFKRQCY